jgi:hypothetical protein
MKDPVNAQACAANIMDCGATGGAGIVQDKANSPTTYYLYQNGNAGQAGWARYRRLQPD